MECSVCVSDRLIGREHELRIGRRLEHLAEEVEAAKERSLGTVRSERPTAAEGGKDDEQHCDRPRRHAVDDVNQVEQPENHRGQGTGRGEPAETTHQDMPTGASRSGG